MCHRRNWHSLRPPGGGCPMPSGVVFAFLWLTAATAPPPPSSFNSFSSMPSNNNKKMSAEGNAQVLWHNPWGDELQPYRIKEKRLHDRGLAPKRKRNGTNGTFADAELSADWRWPSAEKPTPLNEITTIEPNAELTFRANQSELHVRTETWLMRSDQCVEANFRVEGKRTRLLMYTCEMAEGGRCVLDKFFATTELKQLDAAIPSPLDSCHKLQPWGPSSAPFSFHFRFVRRPRKFADRAKELRHWRRRRGRHATREVGRLELNGFRTCKSACGTAEEEGQLHNIQLAGGNYFADRSEGWKRRKR